MYAIAAYIVKKTGVLLRLIEEDAVGYKILLVESLILLVSNIAAYTVTSCWCKLTIWLMWTF